MTDACNRKADYLRVSVTDRCNLRCSYCMPQNGVEMKQHAQILSFEEILRVCEIMAKMGVRKVKVTGGEPLVRKGVVGFIRELKKLRGIEQVTLTTNGMLLEDYLDELVDAGLDAVNISLDALDEQIFEKITQQQGVSGVIKAIDSAVAKGLPVKINTVAIRDVNDDELVKIAGFAKDKKIAVRFIELMPIGLGKGFKPIYTDEIIAGFEKEFGKLTAFVGKLGNGPARYYSAYGFLGKIGFISAMSHNFCDSCNRLRLTSDGLLKPCLSIDSGLDIMSLLRGGESDDTIEQEIARSLASKPTSHKFAEAESDSCRLDREMYRIGG